MVERVDQILGGDTIRVPRVGDMVIWQDSTERAAIVTAVPTPDTVNLYVLPSQPWEEATVVISVFQGVGFGNWRFRDE